MTISWNEHVAAIDVGAAYRGARERITALLNSVDDSVGDDAKWDTIVPHCPEWTVRQTLSHLVGVVDDAVNNNLGGAGTDEWTKVQVDKRADISGAQLLDDWTTYGPFVEDRFTQIGLAGAQGVFDVVTHEHDLRHALGAPGARDSNAISIGLEFLRRNLAGRAAVSFAVTDVLFGGQPLLVEPDSGATDLVVTGSMFDIVRMCSSRRTEAAIRQMNWSADPSSVIAALPFALPQSELNE